MLTRRGFMAAAAGAAGVGALAAAERPNIVMILADDLGMECLGCYGGTSYKTPNLDRMAQAGVRFTHAYAQPLCTPTRLQLMTGLYNNRNWQAFGVMDPKEVTFGHRFQKLGYKTAIAGKWQFYSYNPPDFEPEWRGKGMLVENAGFDEHCVWHARHTEDKGSRYGDPTYQVNGKLVKNDRDQFGDDVFSRFLFGFMEKHRNEPFFAYYPMALTHGPFFASPRGKNWTTSRLKNDKANFPDLVEYMDEVLGRVWKKVEDLGIAERTLILFYSDNGTDRTITSMMGKKVVNGGKGLPTDAGTRVPLIGYWKGKTPVGKVNTDLIDSSDFLPTMLDAVGAGRAKDIEMDGRSFLPQLLGKKGNPREWTYCWHDPRPGHGKEAYTKLVEYARTQRFKLYDDGRFFDVGADELEQRPIAAGQAGADGEKARKMLGGVLQQMKGRGAGRGGKS